MEYREAYEKWLTSPAVDETTRAELKKMKENDAEIYDRFYTDIAFGTGGMRGLMGAGTNRINRYTVRRATLGFAQYLKKHGGSDVAGRGVVIAHDNRRMSREFCLETAGVLAAQGIRAFIFDGLRPTPELSFAVRHCHAAGGVVITASHNPAAYNGYKLYDERGCQLVPRYTDVLIGMINDIADPLSIRSLSPAEAGELITVLPREVDEAYYRAVLSIRLRPVEASSVTVVYSPQHGTGNVPVREVLGRCGYRVIPVEEQCFPDPDFIHTKNPNPETAETYELALDYARKAKADIAITTDPDCDRLGVAVRKDGDYHRLTGNQSGAILLHYILSTRKEQGTLPADAVMCNTVVTSMLGDKVCEKFGVRVDKTLTGFKFIGDRMHSYETEHTGTFVFGYEESYGCLIADFARDKDGVQASLMLCEAAAYYKSKGQTLLDVLDDLYRENGFYLDTQTNVYHEGAAGQKKIEALLADLREHPVREVNGVAVTAVEDYESDAMRAAGFPASNVLRYLFADGSFVAVRPSGTEPKCKYYYCVVGKDEAEAGAKCAALKAVFERRD